MSASYRLGWFLRRVALVSSPLPLVGGVALLFQGESAEGVVLGVLAAALYGVGRDTFGQRTPPEQG
jgi:hypothetical protein